MKSKIITIILSPLITWSIIIHDNYMITNYDGNYHACVIKADSCFKHVERKLQNPWVNI